MRKKKKGKLAETSFWNTFYSINVPKHLDEIPEHITRANFRIWDKVTDEDIKRMVSKIKSIDQLDLDETDITNEAITSLTQLQFIKELRLKGIRKLDNDCIGDLNKLKGLELLHLGSTSITLEGLLNLRPSATLKTILFSDPENKPDAEKMLVLRKLFPNCEFIINHKSYDFGEEEEEY